MMVDKFKNIKAGMFIELLSKINQTIDGVEPTIRVDSEGQYLLSIAQSVKKDFADDYWVTLKYVGNKFPDGGYSRNEMVIATIITLKASITDFEGSVEDWLNTELGNPYLYKRYYIKLKRPLTEEEFKYFLKIDRIYEIDREKIGFQSDGDGGYLNYDSEWLDDLYCWTTYDEIFPMKIISSQRPMMNWDKEPWSDLK
tara:strand:+ start:5302 stop:5895 length:594 start_codon:yes stop_codon:yes gene_type:complete